MANSSLNAGAKPLPRYFVTQLSAGSDLNADAGGADTAKIIASLNQQGWWPTPLRATSTPYAGPGLKTPIAGDFRTTHVGDYSDTSPCTTDKPVTGISIASFIDNMAALVRTLEAQRGERG